MQHQAVYLDLRRFFTDLRDVSSSSSSVITEAAGATAGRSAADRDEWPPTPRQPLWPPLRPPRARAGPGSGSLPALCCPPGAEGPSPTAGPTALLLSWTAYCATAAARRPDALLGGETAPLPFLVVEKTLKILVC